MQTFLILLVLWLGVAAGYLLRRHPVRGIGRATAVLVWLLLFLMGEEVGGNPDVLRGMGRLGAEAFILTVGTALVTVLAAALCWRSLGRREEPCLSADGGQEDTAVPLRVQMRDSLVIVGFFFLGCIAGYNGWCVTDGKASAEELKVLHKLIGKEQEDIEAFSYNTTISAFMIAVNELGAMKCSKREILEPMVILLSPFAPHICEELWHRLGHDTSVMDASFPEYIPAYAAEDSVTYPVQFNGKMRFTVDMPRSASPSEVEQKVLSMEQTARWSEGKSVVKVIVVPGRIINIVLK